MKFKESFPGQPEVKDMTVAVDVPFAEANKDHDEKLKQFEDTLKANKGALDLISGDNTKKKDGKVKNSNLKKMHLSEALFEDMFESSSDDEDLEEALGKDDLKSDIYNALENVMFKYRNNKNITQNDVEQAIEWFIIHFFDFDDEDLDLNEGLDKEKKTLNESENDISSPDDIANILLDKYPKDVEVYDSAEMDSYLVISFLIQGDWKHDHLAFEYWMDKNAAELTNCEVKFNGSDMLDDKFNQDFEGTDSYSAIYEYSFIPNDLASEEDIETFDEEPIEEPIEEPAEEDIMGESLKFNIAKEQLKRFNEGKMPENWSPRVYLENLAKRKHITKEEKAVLEEAFLSKK